MKKGDRSGKEMQMNIPPINDAGSLLNSISADPKTSAIQGAKGSVNADSKSFQDVWTDQSSAAAQGTDAAKSVKESGPKAKSDDKKPADKADKAESTSKSEKNVKNDTEGKSDKTEKSEKTVGTDDKAVGEDVAPEVDLGEAEVLMTAIAAEFLTRTIEVLDITTEEADAILTDLGMTAEDLLDQDNLTQFVLSAIGEEDTAALLTNEEGYAAFKEITAALDEQLAKPAGEIGIKVSDLKQAIEEVKADVKPEITEQVRPEADVIVKTDDSVSKKISVRVSADEDTADVKNATLSDGQTLGAQAGLRSAGRGNDENAHENAAGHQNAQAQAPVNTELNVPAEEAAQSARYADTQEIADQILDYMKAQVKPDMQSLEMQLHPASLGTVKVSLVSEGGNVTANFVAQNESVRAALESQMVQLRDQFEEQGIKVAQIEVTVEARAFDQRSNEQRQDRNDQQGDDSRIRRTRRLNLGPDFGEEDLEELSDEDRLTAEMMKAEGGTVNYTA